MANNNWNNYTEKTATPVDADEVMVRDSADGKNKKLLFGTFWKWVAKKLNEATISELQTSNKTIVGALNQLNSETIKTDNNFTGNVDNVRNSVVWCNTALNAPSNIGLLVSFSTFNIGQIFVDYTQFLIYIRWLNGNTNKWSEWSAI